MVLSHYEKKDIKDLQNNYTHTVLDTTRYGHMESEHRFLMSIEVLAHIDFAVNINRHCKEIGSSLYIDVAIFYRLMDCILTENQLNEAELLDFVTQVHTFEKFINATHFLFDTAQIGYELNLTACIAAHGLTIDQHISLEGERDEDLKNEYIQLRDAFGGIYVDYMSDKDCDFKEYISKQSGIIKKFRTLHSQIQEQRKAGGIKWRQENESLSA